MKKKNLFTSLCTVAALILFVVVYSGCTKEGPAGPAGTNGTNGLNGTTGIDGINGTNGVYANETCKLCHNPLVVEAKAGEYELAKHSWGEAAFDEAGNTGCAPCHESEGFKYVCANNIPSTFTLVSGKYVNDYTATATTSHGAIQCGTCHSSKHTTYGSADLPALTSVATVSMTFFGGAKTINLTQDNGIANLCVKCHQPRPFTVSNGNGRLLSYDTLLTLPADTFFWGNINTTGSASKNKIKVGYRTHTHYGTVGAVYAGVGKAGIDYIGPLPYENSSHTLVASCQDCHMGAINGAAGGHTFKAKGNFNNCNVTGCHTTTPITSTGTQWTLTRSNTKTLLDALATKLTKGGINILNRNPDSESNLWVGLTTNNYDGYLNIYDPINNPNGPSDNSAGQFKNTYPPTTGTLWTTAQITYNNTLPVLYLTNLEMGAIINFQMCLRESSLGIHNTKYTQALLTNTAAMFP